MMKRDDLWLLCLLIILIGAMALVFTHVLPFKFGLDISGGTTLTYQADLRQVKPAEIKDVLEGVKDLIERRVNALGVGEVTVNYTSSGRLIVEIPNVKDPGEAIKTIGETPLLEFRVPAEPSVVTSAVVKKISTTSPPSSGQAGQGTSTPEIVFLPTRLTGRFLQSAQIEFSDRAVEPYVSLQFDRDGAKLFEEITRLYVGKQVAIFLDGQPISAPVVQEVISGGRAQITGRFTIDEARRLTQRLNQGALPVPLRLETQSVISPTLGEEFLRRAIRGGLWGGLLVVLFMLLYYRGLGIVASLALIFYVFFNLALYKIVGVVLSLAGIGGLILSVGMAVDANILVFERTREELRRGRSVSDAIAVGFQRAWTSIRDSNVTTVISALIIYFTTTSFVKGFALTLMLGVFVSMLTAYFLSRILIARLSPIFKRWPKLL